MAQYEYCPTCSSRLFKRKGPIGYFFGCSQYPLCEYTKSFSENILTNIGTDNRWISASEIAEATYCLQAYKNKLDYVPKSYSFEKRQKEGIEFHKSNPYVRKKIRQHKNDCFIATYALGQDHEVTVSLRSFRDDYLLKKKWGTYVVFLYYTLSPYFIKMATLIPFGKLFSKKIVKLFYMLIHKE